MRTGVHEYVLGPHDNERRERWVSTTLRGVRTLIPKALCPMSGDSRRGQRRSYYE